MLPTMLGSHLCGLWQEDQENVHSTFGFTCFMTLSKVIRLLLLCFSHCEAEIMRRKLTQERVPFAVGQNEIAGCLEQFIGV